MIVPLLVALLSDMRDLLRFEEAGDAARILLCFRLRVLFLVSLLSRVAPLLLSVGEVTSTCFFIDPGVTSAPVSPLLSEIDFDKGSFF